VILVVLCVVTVVVVCLVLVVFLWGGGFWPVSCQTVGVCWARGYQPEALGGFGKIVVLWFVGGLGYLRLCFVCFCVVWGWAWGARLICFARGRYWGVGCFGRVFLWCSGWFWVCGGAGFGCGAGPCACCGVGVGFGGGDGRRGSLLLFVGLWHGTCPVDQAGSGCAVFHCL